MDGGGVNKGLYVCEDCRDGGVLVGLGDGWCVMINEKRVICCDIIWFDVILSCIR